MLGLGSGARAAPRWAVKLSATIKDKATRCRWRREQTRTFGQRWKRGPEEAGRGDEHELVTYGGVQESNVLERNGVGANIMETLLSIQVLCWVLDEKGYDKGDLPRLEAGRQVDLWEHHVSPDRTSRLHQSTLGGSERDQICCCRVGKTLFGRRPCWSICSSWNSSHLDWRWCRM